MKKKILLGTAALLANNRQWFLRLPRRQSAANHRNRGRRFSPRKPCADYAKKGFEGWGYEREHQADSFLQNSKELHYSIRNCCETPHSIVFLVVAGPNYDDAVEILKIIADTWGQGGQIQ